MNWGHKITIVIIVFLVGMLGMVFIALRQNNEMVDDEYYKKELAYQQVIDAKKNLLKVSENNIVNQNAREVIFILPVGTFEKFEEGNIELLRPDNQLKDVHMLMHYVGRDKYVIPKTDLLSGEYKARISWKNNGTPYYKEETVYVQK